MTFEEAKKNHVALWDWLARTGEEFKKSYPGWKYNGGNLEIPNRQCCFACTIAGKDAESIFGNPFCEACPIEWAGNAECDEWDGEYNMWAMAQSSIERQCWARLIRDKEWHRKEGQICE
jgi:hypothetical protein